MRYLMNVFVVFIVHICAASIGNVGNYESKESMRDDLSMYCLEHYGLAEGYNVHRKAMLAVGRFSVKLERSERMTEQKRFEIKNAAFLNAIKEMAEYEEVKAEGKEEESEAEKNEELKMFARKRLLGAKILAESEGYDFEKQEYHMEVAVVRSEKTDRVANCAISKDWFWMPEFTNSSPITVEEYLEKSKDSMMLLGFDVVQNGAKDFFLLGIASYEYEDKSDLPNRIKISRKYAVEALECSLGGAVETSTTWFGLSDKASIMNADGWELNWTCSDHNFKMTYVRQEKIEMATYIDFKPILEIPLDSPYIKWLERKGVSPVTGKNVKYVIASIRSHDVHHFVKFSH